eukprot:8317217-Karenia_brevis.AAC.1
MRWVDNNKAGKKGDMDVRSRMVARHFKGRGKDRDDLFIETPPLRAMRKLMSRATTRRQDGRRSKFMFIDVKKAYGNAACQEEVYLDLPQECPCPPGYCGKLRKWMYGMSQAASAWESHYASR